MGHPGAAEGDGGAAVAAAGQDQNRTGVRIRQIVRIRATKQARPASEGSMSTLLTGTRSLLPTLLLVAVVSVLVLVVLPAVLAAAGGTAT